MPKIFALALVAVLVVLVTARQTWGSVIVEEVPVVYEISDDVLVEAYDYPNVIVSDDEENDLSGPVASDENNSDPEFEQVRSGFGQFGGSRLGGFGGFNGIGGLNRFGGFNGVGGLNRFGGLNGIGGLNRFGGSRFFG